MNIGDRMGFDAGSMCLEEALEWAARYGFHYVDFNADRPPNALDAWDEARVRAIRQRCEREHIHDMMAFGSLADRLAGRGRLAACWHEA